MIVLNSHLSHCAEKPDCLVFTKKLNKYVKSFENSELSFGGNLIILFVTQIIELCGVNIKKNVELVEFLRKSIKYLSYGGFTVKLFHSFTSIIARQNEDSVSLSKRLTSTFTLYVNGVHSSSKSVKSQFINRK